MYFFSASSFKGSTLFFQDLELDPGTATIDGMDADATTGMELLQPPEPVPRVQG